MTESGDHTLGQTAAPGEQHEGSPGFSFLYVLFECRRPWAAPLRIPLTELNQQGQGDLQIGRGGTRQFHDTPARLTLPDRWLSSNHARLQYSFGRWILHDLDSKNGCSVNGESISRRELKDGDILELGHCFFLYRECTSLPESGYKNFEDCPVDTFPLTLQADLAYEIEKLEKLAATDISILILGESGSGKEVLAKHLHDTSKRSGDFVPVNCGALPAGLVESELFGHKKGAFSGATGEHLGLVRSADKGTLFLDELADLPPNSQAALLRVLQEKEVRPVGATQSSKVEIRILSATHLDLDELVEQGGFRRDLFARVSGYRITLPPLSFRPEDIGLLLSVFLRDNESGDSPAELTIEAGRKLMRYPWPLNVRELQACLTTAKILADGSPIDVKHLPEPVRLFELSPTLSATSKDDSRKAELLEHLAKHRGNISAVARAMDKDRKQIQRWLKRFSIDIQRFRSSD